MASEPRTRPMGIGHTFSAILGTYQSRFGLLIQIAAIQAGVNASGYFVPDALYPLLTFANWVWWAISYSALFAAALAAYRGEPMTVAEAFRLGARRALFIFGVLVVEFLALGLLVLTIVGIPFACILAVQWSLALPAAVAERTTVDRALSRSWKLVRGQYWRTAWIWTLPSIILGIPIMMLSFWFLWAVLIDTDALTTAFDAAEATDTGVPFEMYRPFGLAQLIASIVGSAVIALVNPFWVLLPTVLYDDVPPENRSSDN